MRETQAHTDVIFGRNNVIEALNSERTIDKILVASENMDGSAKKILAIAREKRIPVVTAGKQKLQQMFPGENTQGVIAYVAQKEYVDPETMIAIANERGEKPFIIIADEIADPHNLGAIIRSADAFGAHGVIISKRRAVGLTAAVEKASGGALNHVAVAKVTNLAATVDWLKEQGVWIYGSDMDAKQCYFDEKFDCSLALIVGSEGNGIGNLLKKKCDILLKIPMKGKVSCLNASVAAGVIMQEIAKYR